MLQNKTRLAIIAVLLLAVLIAILFSFRPAKPIPQSPTVNVNQIETEAVATFAAGLTSTASAIPSETSTSTPPSASTAIETSGVSPTPSCYHLKYVKDITIPDNTLMTPAQVFTKTWLVENTGLCAWRAGFKLVLVGGEAMGGSPFTLPQVANPGDRVELSVKMAAPTNQSGTNQGTWRMTDDNGNLFGDALTVVIDLGGIGTGTPGLTTSTATP